MASSSKLIKHDSFLSPPPQPPPLPPPTQSATTHGVLSDDPLSSSTVLTRPELLRRRLRRLRQLSRVYKDHYWALMEEVRLQYRDYYWKYGTSPQTETPADNRDREREFNGEGCGETNNLHNNNNGVTGVAFGGDDLKLAASNRCAFLGCKLKAMALTSFCHLHILSDPQQKLYKPCNFVIKSAQAGPILCGKPILRSTIPSLCNIHFQKNQKHATRALKKAGLNVSASSKLAPKFHVVIAEYVNQIQSKRRAVQKTGGENIAIKEESMC